MDFSQRVTLSVGFLHSPKPLFVELEYSKRGAATRGHSVDTTTRFFYAPLVSASFFPPLGEVFTIYSHS